MIIRHIELNLDPVLNFRSLKTSFIKLIHNNSLHLINTKLNEYEKNLLDSIPKFKSSPLPSPPFHPCIKFHSVPTI